MKPYTVICTSIATALCSAFLLTWLITPLRPTPVYRVDLARILWAQSEQLQHRAAARQRPLSPQHLRAAIKAVAGTHLVLNSPLVLQGAKDITAVVLAQLGLPPQPMPTAASATALSPLEARSAVGSAPIATGLLP